MNSEKEYLEVIRSYRKKYTDITKDMERKYCELPYPEDEKYFIDEIGDKIVDRFEKILKLLIEKTK